MSGMSSRSTGPVFTPTGPTSTSLRTALRRLGGEFGGDPAADRAADHIDLIEPEPVQQFEMDVGDVVHRIDPVGQAGFAEAGMRRRDQPVARRQQAT